MTLFNTAKHYFSLVKFAHTIFAMPFALIGFSWAWHESSVETFPLTVFVLVVLCMIFARNAAMGFNRYIDREYDKKNQRTAGREIPAGIVTPTGALVFVVVNSALFCLTTALINRLAFCLSFVALSIILGYSYTKRFTSLCHFVLGAGLAIAPTGAYIAMTGTFAWFPVLLSMLVLFWVGGFDILYALPDYGFDKEHQLHSIPVAIGRQNAVLLSLSAHVVSIFIALLIGILFERGLFYWTGCVMFTGLLIYQHLIVSPTKLRPITAAFGLMNGITSVCYAAFTITDILIR
jgi:4-hydroxybenzoate polyprenyltransferase